MGISKAVVVAGVFLLVPLQATAQQNSANRVALVGGTIYTDPAAAPIRDGVVIIENGKIAALGRKGSVSVPRGIQTIDCAGLTVTPGFWNNHVHFIERKWGDAATLPASELSRQLQLMLTQWGYTSVFDAWSMWQNTRKIRDRIDSGEVAGPRVYSTGEAIFPKGVETTTTGWAALGFIPLEGFQISRVSEPEEADAAARRLLDAGADAIKFYAATPGRSGVDLPEAAIKAGVQVAHSRGKLVFSHPTNAAGLMASVKGGVDVLTHTTPQSGAWDATTVAAMKQAGVALIPTLKLWRYEFRHERASLGDRFVQTAEGQLRAWLASGGQVLFGTDVGYMSDYDPTEEYELMAEAGMNFRQILASLTTGPPSRLGGPTPGRIAPGATADLTILKSDPANDVRAFAAVAYTIRDGKTIFHADH
jgi:imidazolonepropionase-like amidohydrolase